LLFEQDLTPCYRHDQFNIQGQGMFRLSQEKPDDVWDVEYLFDLSFAPAARR